MLAAYLSFSIYVCIYMVYMCPYVYANLYEFHSLLSDQSFLGQQKQMMCPYVCWQVQLRVAFNIYLLIFSPALAGQVATCCGVAQSWCWWSLVCLFGDPWGWGCRELKHKKLKSLKRETFKAISLEPHAVEKRKVVHRHDKFISEIPLQNRSAPVTQPGLSCPTAGDVEHPLQPLRVCQLGGVLQ